jgi:hypothetical protein
MDSETNGKLEAESGRGVTETAGLALRGERRYLSSGALAELTTTTDNGAIVAGVIGFVKIDGWQTRRAICSNK